MNGHGGHRPGAGRKPGSQSRLAEYRDRMLTTFARHGYDPVEALIKLANDPATEPKLQARIHADLLQYVAPRLKATEKVIEEDRRVLIEILKFSQEDFPTRTIQAEPVKEIIEAEAVAVEIPSRLAFRFNQS